MTIKAQKMKGEAASVAARHLKESAAAAVAKGAAVAVMLQQ